MKIRPAGPELLLADGRIERLADKPNVKIAFCNLRTRLKIGVKRSFLNKKTIIIEM
jgi:hypothetical protein